jgi:hypothetical protein
LRRSWLRPIVLWFLATTLNRYAVQLRREQGEVNQSVPKSKEFTIRMEDQPGYLGKCCRTLAERGVNILAFEAFPFEGQSVVRFVADNPATARTVLDAERMYYTETEVAQAKLANRPGELGVAAARLGEANININYAYCGADPASNSPLVIFGVTDVARAATLLDEIAAKAA